MGYCALQLDLWCRHEQVASSQPMHVKFAMCGCIVCIWTNMMDSISLGVLIETGRSQSFYAYWLLPYFMFILRFLHFYFVLFFSESEIGFFHISFALVHFFIYHFHTTRLQCSNGTATSQTLKKKTIMKLENKATTKALHMCACKCIAELLVIASSRCCYCYSINVVKLIAAFLSQCI